MKRHINISGLLATLFLGFAACQDPVNLEIPNDPVQDGYVRVSFTAQTPDMAEVKTKVVDPDGEDISNMTLFCFDARGLFISTVTATMTPDQGSPSLSGSFEAVIPEITERIHFVANQNMSLFPESEFISKSETEVLSAMEGSSGMMIYWSRFVKASGSDIASQLSGTTVGLVRNHAKISVSDAGNRHGKTITGFVAVNTNAFGTVAPYCETHEWEAPSYEEGRIFVTIPHDDSKLSDINDVRTIASEPDQYVFESPNTSDDPVDVILRDEDGKYYRVMLMDAAGEFVPIMRNHSYVINIAGPLSYGQDSFGAALTAPATNNVWLSISDDIKTVSGNGYTLSVDETHVVLSEMPSGGTLDLGYSLSKDGGNITSERPTVTWLDGNTVAQHTISHSFTNGNGTITVTLNQFGNDETVREGTLLVKYGSLQRKIKVTTFSVQSFTPAWVTTNVYGTETGEKVTMMFHIPETVPSAMFPMDVMVSVNDLDVRNESGMALPLIRQDDARYGKHVYVLQDGETDVFSPTDADENPIGYKYVLTVTQPGTQRVYFETILSHKEAAYIDVTIEADHFQTITKRATFQNTSDQYILLHNLHSYSAELPADDVIYYYLVPQKKGAVVDFPAHLGKDIVWNDDHTVDTYTPVAPGASDEFILYSEYLDHDTSASDLDFVFYPIDETFWSTGGRTYGFTRDMDDYQGGSTTAKGAVFHMITNNSNSREVVRIASNPAGQPSVTGSGTSSSAAYRSAVFELSTFHPFHFAAEFNGEGTIISGNQEEVVDYVEIPYGVGQDAVIEFDVTSFMSVVNDISAASQMVSVDPFGRSFEIYIDAPMLELDTDALSSKLAGKVKSDPSVPGRFIYTVDASRESERQYGSARAAVADNSTYTYLDRENSVTVDQSGERKVIPFRTKDIVSAGDIVISSQTDEVVFHEKVFKLTNKSVSGSIRYGESASSLAAVPARSFVPMERTYDNTRIGSVTVTSAGTYELRLRAEYEFDWNTDEIMFEFTAGGKHYSAKVSSLAALVANPDLALMLSE